MIRVVPFMTDPSRADVYLVTDGLYQGTIGRAAVGVSNWILLEEGVEAGWSDVVAHRFRQHVLNVEKEVTALGEERPRVPGGLLALALTHPQQ